MADPMDRVEGPAIVAPPSRRWPREVCARTFERSKSDSASYGTDRSLHFQQSSCFLSFLKPVIHFFFNLTLAVFHLLLNIEQLAQLEAERIRPEMCIRLNTVVQCGTMLEDIAASLCAMAYRHNSSAFGLCSPVFCFTVFDVHSLALTLAFALILLQYLCSVHHLCIVRFLFPISSNTSWHPSSSCFFR